MEQLNAETKLILNHLLAGPGKLSFQMRRARGHYLDVMTESPAAGRGEAIRSATRRIALDLQGEFHHFSPTRDEPDEGGIYGELLGYLAEHRIRWETAAASLLQLVDLDEAESKARDTRTTDLALVAPRGVVAGDALPDGSGPDHPERGHLLAPAPG